MVTVVAFQSKSSFLLKKIHMKKYTCLLILFATIVFASCKKDKIEYSNDFEKSSKAWTEFKSVSNNSYRYITGSESWTGYSTETTITVSNGQVIGRSYIAKGRKDDQTTLVIIEQWQEDINSLNTHNNGATLLTLDQIYELAKTDLLLKRQDASISFEANNFGMISTAGYVLNGCQDDCFTGIKIKSISKYVP